MGRPTLPQVYMKFASSLAERATCSRLQVGTVITTADLEQVLAIGYNGNAKGLPNKCDSDEPGKCGCIHSEANALVKCGRQSRDKVMFVTMSPCVMCAKLIINCGFSKVFFAQEYRLPDGLILLRSSGIETCELAVD